MSIEPKTGEEIIYEMTGLLQECSTRRITEFEERRLTTNIEKIPNDHFRLMCWGMLYSIKGDKEKSLSYHEASFEYETSYLGILNYSGSQAYLGLYDDSISTIRKAIELDDANLQSAKFQLMKRLVGAGYYVEPLQLINELEGYHELDELNIVDSIHALNKFLGTEFEADFQKLYSSLTDFCLSKDILIFPVFQIKVIADPESDDYKTVLVILVSRESKHDTSSIISDFIMSSEVIDQVNPEILMKVSFSISEVIDSGD